MVMVTVETRISAPEGSLDQVRMAARLLTAAATTCAAISSALSPEGSRSPSITVASAVVAETVDDAELALPARAGSGGR